MSRALIEAAAWGAILGVGGMALLTCEDDFEEAVRYRVTERALALEHERAKLWANEIAHSVSQLFRK